MAFGIYKFDYNMDSQVKINFSLAILIVNLNCLPLFLFSRYIPPFSSTSIFPSSYYYLNLHFHVKTVRPTPTVRYVLT